MILAASNGMTLYTFDPDPPGMSVCNVGCIETWPPLVLSAGEPVAPPGLAGALTTFVRADGRRQVAYAGRPLYFYDGDRQPGGPGQSGVDAAQSGTGGGRGWDNENSSGTGRSGGA